MIMGEAVYYKNQVEYQQKLFDMQQQRLKLEQDLFQISRGDKKCKSTRNPTMRKYYKQICEREKRAITRNDQLVQDLTKKMKEIYLIHNQTTKLQLLRKKYEDEIISSYPAWKHEMNIFKAKKQLSERIITFQACQKVSASPAVIKDTSQEYLSDEDVDGQDNLLPIANKNQSELMDSLNTPPKSQLEKASSISNNFELSLVELSASKSPPSSDHEFINGVRKDDYDTQSRLRKEQDYVQTPIKDQNKATIIVPIPGTNYENVDFNSTITTEPSQKSEHLLSSSPAYQALIQDHTLPRKNDENFYDAHDDDLENVLSPRLHQMRFSDEDDSDKDLDNGNSVGNNQVKTLIGKSQDEVCTPAKVYSANKKILEEKNKAPWDTDSDEEEQHHQVEIVAHKLEDDDFDFYD